MSNFELNGRILTAKATGITAKLTTKHAPLFLRLLVACTQNNERLTYDMLSAHIQQDEAGYRLHRNQVLRMLTDMTKALEAVGATTRILPKQTMRSSGPWKLSKTSETFEVESITTTQDVFDSDYFDWDDSLSRAQTFREFIQILLDAHVLAQEGYLEDVLLELQKCYEYPIKPKLTYILHLQRAKYLSMLGKFDDATALAREVIERAELDEDIPAVSFATFLLARMAYNQAPAKNYTKLIESATKPTTFLHSDEQAEMYWHNLRALLYRRQAVDTPEQAPQYMKQAQYHIEHSIFLAIRQNNIEMTLDFMMNTAFFYQAFVDTGLTSIEEVLGWYQLVMRYEEKTEFGNQASWGVVFLAEFYLSHQDKIDQTDAEALLDKANFNPAKMTYYEKAIPHIERCGDARQLVIFLIAYFRYLVIKNEEMKSKIIARKAFKVIDAQPPAFFTALKNEGYKAYLSQMKTRVTAK